MSKKISVGGLAGFYRKLNNLVKSGNYRKPVKPLPSDSIRLYFKGNKNYEYCPVTAVANSMTGHIFAIDDFYQAGKAIGLSRELVIKIVSGADESDKNSFRSSLIKATYWPTK